MVAMMPRTVQNAGSSRSGRHNTAFFPYLGTFIEQFHLEGVDLVRRQSLTRSLEGAPLLWTTPKCLA